jgi:cysteine desulfurase
LLITEQTREGTAPAKGFRRSIRMKRIYLDHAATTPVRPEVRMGILPYMETEFGNPSSLHDWGQHAHDAVEHARKQLLRALEAESPREIVFTGGGTESNNLAIQGVAKKRRHIGRHIITTQIEHPSVLETCRSLKESGFEVTELPVDENGLVRVEDVERALRSDTILVSIMAANNEVGTIQPIAEIGRLLHDKHTLFHTDAVQFFGKVPFSVQDLHVDLLTIGGHKIGGPKGVGALYVRKGVRISPIVHGGGHERGMRPGTYNVPAIVGLGIAAELAAREAEETQERLTRLRDRLWRRIETEIGEVRLNGHPEQRLPNNLNLSFHRIEGQAVMLELNRMGVAVSSGSACSAGKHAPSHVLMAMGRSQDEAHQSVRISLGSTTTEEEIDLFVDRLKEVIVYLRSLIR